MHTLYIPRGFLHGFQALTATADTCYRIDAEHDPSADIAVAFDDPELGIAWPLPPCDGQRARPRRGLVGGRPRRCSRRPRSRTGARATARGAA